MSERQKCYRAHVNWDYRGATVWCHYGYISPCGEWVEVGDTRHRRTAEWFDTEAAAKASKADEVAQMGAKLINQAAELRGGAA
jgi:hypothetical protein